MCGGGWWLLFVVVVVCFVPLMFGTVQFSKYPEIF